MKYLFIIALFFSSKPAAEYFCTCMLLRKSVQIDSSDLIFTGRVKNIDTLYIMDSAIHYTDTGARLRFTARPNIKVTFIVEQYLKGKPTQKEWFVYTTYKCCSCGFPFAYNTDYLIMADKSDVIDLKPDPTGDYINLKEFAMERTTGYFTSICSANELATGSIIKDITNYLKDPKKYKKVIDDPDNYMWQ